MAEFRVSLGAVADVVSTKELSEAVTGLQGHIRKHAYKPTEKPIRRRFTQADNKQMAFGNQTVAIIGSAQKTPSVGKYWIVRSVVIFDNSAALTAEFASSIGGLCIGDAAAPVPTDLTGFTFTGLPASDTFNSTSIRVNPNENVYIALNNATTNNLAFTVEIDEYCDYEIEAQSL